MRLTPIRLPFKSSGFLILPPATRVWVMTFFTPPVKTMSVEPFTYAATLPMPPVIVISASPPSKAAVTMLDDEMNTRLKSRLFFLKIPASWATQG